MSARSEWRRRAGPSHSQCHADFQMLLLWSAVLLTALISLTLFAALTLLERLVYERFR